MATYHLNFRHCSKAKGQSAKAKSDYIDREDKYSKKLEDLQYSSSGNMPSFAQNNPKEFWECADIYERSNARVCTEIVFALPRELDLEQQKELVADFVKHTIDNERQKLPYSLAIHNDKNNHNPHCHLIFSERHQDGIDRPAEKFFKRANSKSPELGGAKKSAYANSREFVQDVRTMWRELANQHLERHGHTARIDERTLSEQGIEREASRRINRPEFQAMRALERENEKIGQDLALMGQKIAQEKACEAYVQQVLAEIRDRPRKQAEADLPAYLEKCKQTQEVAQNTPKNDFKRFSSKSEEIHTKTEKTPQRTNEGLSQADFDEYLVKNWLEPSRKLANAAEKRSKLEEELAQHTKDRNSLVKRYEAINEPQGWFGLWETKAQKQEKQAISNEFEKVKALQATKQKELDELNERIEKFRKATIEPLEKQIERFKAGNPDLKMRNTGQLNSMQFKGVLEWHREAKERQAEREQRNQKRELERQQERKSGLSL